MATKGSLGVFIDSKTVYAAFLAGAQRSTCAVPIAGTPEDLDYDAKITDAVRSAVEQLAPGQKSVLLTIPGEFSMVRSFELPVLPKKEEAPAIRFEAVKYIPFDLKDICFDYDVILTATKKRMNVLFYAARKNVVDRLVACLEGAGLAVSAVEILANSLARSFNQEIVKNSGAPYMLIRVNENESAEVVIARNQTVLLSRHVALSGEPKAGWDSTAFLAELQLSFGYFDDVFKGQAISKVYVSSSEREHMQTLAELVHNTFSIDVEAVSSAPPGNAGESSAGVAAAHGLALRDALPTRDKKINLRVSAGGKTGGSAQSAIKDFAIKVVLGAAVVAGGVYFYFSQMVNSKKAEFQRVSSGVQGSAMTPASTAPAQLNDRLTALGVQETFLAESIDKRRFFTLKMNMLARSVPPGILLKALMYNDDVSPTGESAVSLKIEGVVLLEDSAEALPVINRMVTELNLDPDFMKGFSQIRLSSTKQGLQPNGKPGVHFEIDCASAARKTM